MQDIVSPAIDKQKRLSVQRDCRFPKTSILAPMRFRFSFLFRGNKLLTWVQQQFSPKQFLIFSSVLIGLTAGLAAVFLKLFVHLIFQNVTVLSRDKQLYVAMFPLIGIALCVIYV